MLVAVLIVVLLCFCWQRRFVNLLLKIPTYPKGLPILGNVLLCMVNNNNVIRFVKSISNFANTQKGVVKAWFGPIPLLVITNPEDADVVLNNCLEKCFIYNFSKPWVGEGLVTSDVPKWKNHIKKLSPAFNQRVLDGFIDIFNRQSSIFVDNLKRELYNEFDMCPYIGAANLETICQTAMGTPMNLQTPSHPPYLDAIQKILIIITRRATSAWLYPNFIFNLTKDKRNQDAAIHILHDLSNTVIKKKRLNYKGFRDSNEANETPLLRQSFHPFLELMLELNTKATIFTDEQIRAEVDTMIAAGQETTSYVLFYTLLLLGSHKDVQNRVYDELKDVFGTSERCVEKDDFTKLIYLEAVLKESMRLYPVVPVILRYINKELKLKNYTIPEGCNCAVSIWGINRHERWGKDYNTFRPERWFEIDSVPDHPAAFATFSFGRRLCIGRQYAMMSMKTTLSHFLRRYKIHSDVTRLKMKINFVLKPISGHKMKIELRHDR